MSTKHVIAVDLGASSGRVMRADFDGQRVAVSEVHRFPNMPVQVGKTLYWDVLRLWHEITTGIAAAAPGAAGIGVDTWGVDFALLDRDGHLLASPVHYRDERTEGMYEWVFARVPRREVFMRTGIQFMLLNTLYQLASLAASDSCLLDAAESLLMMPDLFHYWLSGERVCEFTEVTTSQCYNPHADDWDRAMLGQLNVPTRWFGKIVPPGTRLGSYQGIPVIVPASHDTGSAVVAVPTTTTNYAYLSSGTWSLIGLEVTTPVINDEFYTANVTNEGGAYGTFRLLRNVTGLWLSQQCRATWEAEGHTYSYAELTAWAAEAEPFRWFIDPDDPAYATPGDMPARIRACCQQTGQSVPETVGQIMRTIYESLALKYRLTLDDLIALTGRTVDRLHIIGGGSQNDVLNQMTANAIGRLVITGPVEATAMGNAIVQLIALGELADVTQARAMLSRTVETRTVQPQDTALWEEQLGRYKAFLSRLHPA